MDNGPASNGMHNAMQDVRTHVGASWTEHSGTRRADQDKASEGQAERGHSLVGVGT